MEPDLLILARELRGLSQTELAAKARVSQSLVSRAEAGLVELEADNATRLADALEFPPAFFSQDTRVRKGGDCLHYRRRSTMGIKRLRMVEAKAALWLLVIESLTRDGTQDGELGFHHLDVGADGDFDSPTSAADWLRAKWGLGSGPIVDLVASVEAQGGIVVFSDLGTPKVDALSRWEPPLPPVFVLNECIPGDRARWTLAHEVAHVSMHHRPTPHPEEEADEFASEFLMPASSIRSQLVPFEMARLGSLKIQWKSSIAALGRRARDLGVISQDSYRTFNIQLSMRGWRKHEPVEIPRESPTRLRQAIEGHRTELGYGEGELAAKLRLSVKDYMELLGPVASGTTTGPRLRPL